jgi:anion-transporting  ArsA/GET3 family ATPase
VHGSLRLLTPATQVTGEDEEGGDEGVTMKDMSARDLLAGTSVILCTGAGGVGKTTTAAALARQAAYLGRSAVVVTIDPARRLADALGISERFAGESLATGTSPVRVPLDAPGELWAMMLDASAMFDAVVREQASDAEQADRILTNSFYRSIAGSLGGTQEYMASEVLHRLHGDPRWDLVVVDTPPSRASLRFLGAPDVLTRFLEHRAFRAMMLAGGSGGRLLSAASQPLLKVIGSVVGGAALTDAVAFFQAFAGMETGFRLRSREVTELLAADSTAFVVVTTAQADNVTEAMWFRDQLIAGGHQPRAIIVNRVHPRWAISSTTQDLRVGMAETSLGSLPDDRSEVLLRNLEWLTEIADSEAVQISRLREGAEDLVVAQVPLLATEVESAEGMDVIGSHLREQLMTTGA